MKKHYVDNKEFLKALLEHKEIVNNTPEGELPPPPSNFIGQCIIDITNGIASRPNFSGYSYIDEMKFDGIENAVRALMNFDPEKTKNPFGYFSMIIWRAFLRRLEKEKKESYIKHMSYVHHYYDSVLDPNNINMIQDHIDDRKAAELVEHFKKKPKLPKEPKNIIDDLCNK